MSNDRGRLIILSSPSGGGKTTVYKRLLTEIPDLAYSISTTTRAMRTGEIDGKDYFFVTPARFRSMIRQGAFLEWEKVYGRYYGTRKDLVEGFLSQGRDCIMDLDVKGGSKLKKNRPDSLAVFLLPPSFPILKKRLEGRATDQPREIARRFREAVHELKYCPDYDYIVVNEDLDETVRKLKKLIRGES
jgi:guanylate kinase